MTEQSPERGNIPGFAHRAPLRATLWMGIVALVLTAAPPASAYPRPGLTERVSVASDGGEGNGFSSLADIDAHGRHIVFGSGASNLVPGDANGLQDVFVHDREAGITERVSVASDGTEASARSWLGNSPDTVISADGRQVVFLSDASNLVPGDTNGSQDVFVHDRETGITERVSVGSDGAEANGASDFPASSADGRYVTFFSAASNLVPGDTNGSHDIFVHDRETGITERVSVGSDGVEGNNLSSVPAMTPDGRHVSFTSLASNLVPGDTNSVADIFVHDRETGITERVSVTSSGDEASGGPLFGGSSEPAISADGRQVSFRSDRTNLVPADTNATWDIFVHDRETGITERVSVASDGAEGNGTLGSFAPSISTDGRHIVFPSDASNLVPGDTNGKFDVFVHDREAGTTERVSLTSGGEEVDGLSMGAAISDDGRHVVFRTDASTLVSGDTNGTTDVFVRDRGPDTGTGALDVQESPSGLHVSGWATFSGQAVTSGVDPPDDGGAVSEQAGAELTGASVTYRAEAEDLLVRLQVASFPRRTVVVPQLQMAHTVAGAPGVLYALGFDIEGIRHEVRALRAGATGVPPAAPYFALYRCEVACSEQARLSGGIGTTGSEVVVSVPLSLLGASEGTVIDALRAFTAFGESAPGALMPLDEVGLPRATIPRSRVELGIAPASTPEHQVPFTVVADLLEGKFSATVATGGLAAGTYRVWARACLGAVCGPAPSRAVTL